MDIENIKLEKLKVEHYINELVNSFMEKTGVNVFSLSCDIVDVSTNNKPDKYLCSKVNLKIII